MPTNAPSGRQVDVAAQYVAGRGSSGRPQRSISRFQPRDRRNLYVVPDLPIEESEDRPSARVDDLSATLLGSTAAMSEVWARSTASLVTHLELRTSLSAVVSQMLETAESLRHALMIQALEQDAVTPEVDVVSASELVAISALGGGYIRSFDASVDLEDED